MKLILLALFFFCIYINIVLSQLFDFCSNGQYLNEYEDECLKIGGCCYAEITSELDGLEELIGSSLKSEDKNPLTQIKEAIYPTKYDDNYDKNTFKTCFKKYKKNADETCLDYNSTIKDLGNKVVKCNCNDLF